MSRSSYSDDCDGWDLIRWRGAVASAIRGRRGQAFLREMLAALDAMPEKRLIRGRFIENGEACALGVVALARGCDVSKVDPEDSEQVAGAFGISEALAAEIEYENDEFYDYGLGAAIYSPGERLWRHMRAWVAENITEGSTVTGSPGDIKGATP